MEGRKERSFKRDAFVSIVLGARNATVNKTDKAGSFFKGTYLPISYCFKIMTLYSVMEVFIFLVLFCYLLNIMHLSEGQ